MTIVLRGIVTTADWMQAHTLVDLFNEQYSDRQGKRDGVAFTYRDDDGVKSSYYVYRTATQLVVWKQGV